MSVQKFRSVEEMPRAERVGDDEIPARIRASWQRAFGLCPRELRRGVRRFRSIDEANADRHRETVERMRRTATEG